jgi:hypothetical protein
MRRWLFFFILAAILTGCSTRGAVTVAGRFAAIAPPPEEIRVMMDDAMKAADEGTRGSSFVSVMPAEDGSFESDRFFTESARWSEETPIFYMAFGNERDVLYAVGERHGAIQYRAFDAESKEPLDRAGTCWRIMRAAFERQKRALTLRLFLTPNFDSEKSCLPPGTYRPEELAVPPPPGE